MRNKQLQVRFQNRQSEIPLCFPSMILKYSSVEAGQTSENTPPPVPSTSRESTPGLNSKAKRQKTEEESDEGESEFCYVAQSVQNGCGLNFYRPINLLAPSIHE